MKLFFDEDNGTGIPRALSLLRIADTEVHFASTKHGQMIRKGTPDTVWLPRAGREGWLVVSQNKHILDNEVELDLLVRHGVGAVFIGDGRSTAVQVMRTLLNRWDWLRAVDEAPRPFAYLLEVSGAAWRLDLSARSPLGARQRVSTSTR